MLTVVVAIVWKRSEDPDHTAVKVAPPLITANKGREISLTTNAPDMASLGISKKTNVQQKQPPVKSAKGKVTTAHNAFKKQWQPLLRRVKPGKI